MTTLFYWTTVQNKYSHSLYEQGTCSLFYLMAVAGLKEVRKVSNKYCYGLQ